MLQKFVEKSVVPVKQCSRTLYAFENHFKTSIIYSTLNAHIGYQEKKIEFLPKDIGLGWRSKDITVHAKQQQQERYIEI